MTGRSIDPPWQQTQPGLGPLPDAEAWTILVNVMHTAQQQGRDAMATIKEFLFVTWADGEATAPADSP